MLKTTIVALTLKYCAIYHVKPEFALAVANTESRIPGVCEFREGLVGYKKDLIAPFNLHKDFAKRWPEIWDLDGNCKRGVMALRPMKGEKTRKDVLRRYNPKMTEAYYQAVMSAMKRYKLEVGRE